MNTLDTVWNLVVKYNEMDEEWYSVGGQKGSHIVVEDGETIHYFDSSPCPSCGGTEGYYEVDGDTHHWCGYVDSVGLICGDCNSPINDLNPSLERIQTQEMMPAIHAMRDAKGLKEHHPSGCLRCLEQHRTTGKLPHNIEHRAMGIPFNPDLHWRKEDMDDDTEILRSDDLAKDLRRWFKEKWVDVSRKDKDGKHPPCGRGEAKLDSKGYPKCRPSKKVSEDTPETSRGMSAKEKKAATRRKRSKPQGVGGKPTMVKMCDCDTCDTLAKAFVIREEILKGKKEKPFHGYNPNKHSRKGGLNAKGRAKFKREEGANLKPPVTEKPSSLKPGSKKAKRRKSFCARMSGVKGPTSKGGKLTPKGAALKRWNC